MRSISEIIELAKKGEPRVIAVAAAHDKDVLTAVDTAAKAGLCKPILVGNGTAIKELMPDAAYPIMEAETDEDCAQIAVKLVRDGAANCLMKGILPTSTLIRAVLNKENGIRSGKLLSHVMAYETDIYDKLLFNTDGGVNVAPTLEQKADILENAAKMLSSLGYKTMTTACICGAEQVNPKIPATVDANEIAAMTDRFTPYGMTIIGPVGLDLAISKAACAHKHFEQAGGGDADILLFPNYEAGNVMGKTLTYFSGAKSAGVVVGAKVPIVLVSRADTAETKMSSIALGCVIGG